MHVKLKAKKNEMLFDIGILTSKEGYSQQLEVEIENKKYKEQINNQNKDNTWS